MSQYYDDYTHVAVYSHVNRCDLLRVNDYQILECAPALTIKSRMPVVQLLIRLYGASPWKPLAGQMLVRCRPNPEKTSQS